MYRTIEAGSMAVTIVAEDRRVWIAATVNGKVGSAEGMRLGGLFGSAVAVPGLESPVRWRPVYDRAPSVGYHWLWLKTLVNAVRIEAGGRTAHEVAAQLAKRLRRYLAHTYRKG
ncbi:MAG: hypothetical protein OXC31_16495 [Spirochaetaceae bacterium]|nr:hypothetical protein [Spirochaetaceae bacterium]